MTVSKESALFPVGTIFVDRGNYRTGDSVILFYQVVRCTERTVWYLQIRAQVVAYDSAVLRKDLDCGHLQPKGKTTHGTHSPRENIPLRKVTNRRRDAPVGRPASQPILRILTRKKRWLTKETKVGHRFYC